MTTKAHYKPSARSPLSPEEQLAKMLETRTFDQLLKDGDLLDVTAAAKRTGYAEWSVRRLCATGKLGGIQRNGSDYFFLPWQLQGVFKSVPARKA